MMRKLTRDQEIAEYLGRLMGNPEDDIRKQFILNVSKLDSDEMRLLAEIAEKMAEGK